MTSPRGARWSLPLKVTALALLVELVLAAAVLALAKHHGARLSFGSGAVIAVVIVGLPVAMVYTLTRFLVVRFTVPLTDAYRRLAGGDFTAELPAATGGRDFLGVRDGFRAMADALERTLAEVRGADRERRRLFADLAHELATPTTTLLGLAAALRDGVGDRDRLLAHLERESARLERLIADVRELAMLEDPALPLDRVPCEVGATTRTVVERLALAHPITAELSIDAAEVFATVDPLRLDQIVTNLVTNALRHAGDHAIAVAVRAAGDAVELTVDDAGPGVPDDRLPDLGRRLLRVDAARDRAAGGHGLGLSIVRAIVARHGGTVSFARSRLGGLGVTVRLPRG